MPFQSWEIRPHGPGCVIFTLIAASVELEISIKENACCLNSPEDYELDGIRNKWLPSELRLPKTWRILFRRLLFYSFCFRSLTNSLPGHILIQKLMAAGINVFPSEDADKYVSISNKVQRVTCRL